MTRGEQVTFTCTNNIIRPLVIRTKMRYTIDEGAYFRLACLPTETHIDRWRFISPFKDLGEMAKAS